MENRTNQAGQSSSASSQNNPSASTQNTSSAQSKGQNASASSQQQGQSSYTSQSQSQQSPNAQQQGRSSDRNQQQGSQGQQGNGVLGGITSKLSNIQVPQAVKDFGSTVSRSYGGLTTTQKVVGGAALALGASYWAAKSSGWVGQGKANKNRNKSGR